MPALPRLTLLVHVAATLFMTGVIWFVQVVHYPLFAGVGSAEFSAYERQHADRTTWIVAPAMLLELATAVALFFVRPPGVSVRSLAIGLFLVMALWASTAFVQVPCHDRLVQSFDADIHDRLVATNWFRTVGWSLRGVLVLAMVSGAMSSARST